MEIFDKRFVHFMWNPALKGKRGFLSSGIDTLIKMVNEDSDRTEIQKGCERDLPFCKHITVECRLAYYDPNYEVKRAFYKEGKQIQVAYKGANNWVDCDEPEWVDGCQFRIKPEEEKWIAYLAMPNGNGCYLTACAEDAWNEAKQIFGAKTKLVVGTKSEVEAWYKSRQKFAKVIKAWEDGKTIQIYGTLFKKWSDCAGTLEWYTDCEYRVKPECPCEEGIDSKACAGCEHSEDGKKKYRPYESPAEMIVDFIDRFKVNCPSYCEPLIWVKGKGTDNRYLVFAFCENGIEFNDDEPFEFEPLFDCYTYLDGSPCGKEY